MLTNLVIDGKVTETFDESGFFRAIRLLGLARKAGRKAMLVDKVVWERVQRLNSGKLH